MGASPIRHRSLMAALTIVFTADYAAQRFRVDPYVIEELAEEITPELGCLSVIESTNENARAVTAFTHRGLEFLEDLLEDRRSEFMKDLLTRSGPHRMDTERAV
jgi:hypothetical protein